MGKRKRERLEHKKERGELKRYGRKRGGGRRENEVELN